MAEQKRALILDLDGVVVGKPTPFLKTLGRYAIHGSKLFEPTLNISDATPEYDAGLTPLEWILFRATARRKVTQEAREYIYAQSESGNSIYINTGRPNRRQWINATLRTLDQGQVLPPVREVVFKNLRVQSEIGKAINAQKISKGFEHVTVVDDNPLDGLMIAKLLPEAEVIILQSLTGGILFSRVEHQNYPNVRRVASLKHIASQI